MAKNQSFGINNRILQYKLVDANIQSKNYRCKNVTCIMILTGV